MEDSKENIHVDLGLKGLNAGKKIIIIHLLGDHGHFGQSAQIIIFTKNLLST